jgi:multiple sugar transport system permease protein
MVISRYQRNLSLGLYYGILMLLTIPFAIPLLWMVSIAFRPTADIFTSPPQWIPSELTLDNFRKAWRLLDMTRFIGNTALITGLSIIGSVLSSSVVGYSFAIIPARGKNILFFILLMTIMVPSAVTLIPLYLLFSGINMTNSFVPLILPHYFANAFYVFLFRQFFLGIPKSIFEYAEIDGCNPLQSYWHIALPISRPAMTAVVVFVFISSWNDFLGPLIYLNTADKYTISLGLSMFQGIYYTQLQYLMPLSVVALLPVIIMFFIAQRYLVSGIKTTGIKI